MKPEKKYIIEAEKGRSFLIAENQRIKIIDIEGQQVADFVAFNKKNTAEKLSTGATLDVNSSLFIKEGDSLYSNRYNKMFTVAEDTVGKHDILYPACSQPMYECLYDVSSHHPNCLENLLEAVRIYNLSIDDIPIPFNIFMNTEIFPDGSLHVKEPLSSPGDYIILEAKMDAIVAVAACAEKESKCNNFNCTSIEVDIIS